MTIEILRVLDRIVEPSTVLSAVVLAGAIATVGRRWSAALILQSVAATIVLLVGILPGGTWLILPLETRFPENPSLPANVAGIIALGGTERVARSAAWGQPMLSDATPIAFLVSLGRRYPEARLVFTGGSGLPDVPGVTEARVVRDFLEQTGVDTQRMLYEERSRNTLENAQFTRDLLQPKAGERWLLVAQAISLPRAVGAFRHAGMDVIAFPAGYLTDGPANSVDFHLTHGLSLASVALHEWGGLFVYRIMGYTDELFPR